MTLTKLAVLLVVMSEYPRHLGFGRGAFKAYFASRIVA